VGIFLLIDQGIKKLDTSLYNVVKESFPEIYKTVTSGHLLSHTSGIYDCVDEELIEDFDNIELPIPNQKRYNPQDYTPTLHGEMKFSTGEILSYSNSGYILLSLVFEKFKNFVVILEKEEEEL
jgi:CubicO group peptidase (beta-lactamase class C family)